MVNRTTTIELNWFEDSEVNTRTMEILDEEALEHAWNMIGEGYREGELTSIYHDSVGNERSIRGWWKKIEGEGQ